MEIKLGQDKLQLTGTIEAVETPQGDGPEPAELAKYRVQLTAAGQIARGFDWDLKVPEATLKRDYAKFNKAGSYVNAAGNHVPSYMQSMKDKVGFFRRAKWNAETKTIDADLVLARTTPAEEFKAQLDLDLANNNSMVQFSAVYSYDFSETETKKNGNTHYVVTVDKIREVFSVDAVDRGAFPMKPLAALSEWQGKSSKEDEMAKEVETAQVEQETKPAAEGVDVAALIAENQQRDKEVAELRAQHAEMAQRDAERETAFKAQQEGLAELQAGLRKQTNEAHFATKVATLPADDPGVAKLREAIDFAKVDTAGIDALVDPFVASLTAAGRVEMDKDTIKVTQDAEDTRTALLASAVLGDTYKDDKDNEYNADSIEQVIGEHYGDKAAQHSPQLVWSALNEAYLKHGLNDAEIDADAMGQPVAKLGDASVGTGDSWGARLLQTIVTVARILHDGSEMTGWINTLIPAMHRVTVPDFNDRYYRYTGTFEQLKTVAEDAAVPDVAVSDSFRVPVKPIKKQGKFYLTYEQVMNSPTAAMRSLAQAMGISISSTDYTEILNLMFGIGNASSNSPDRANALTYETATGDAGTRFYTLANGNFLQGAASAPRPVGGAWSYEQAVRAIDWMYAQTAYGEDNFSLAGMIRAATAVVPPSLWGSAEAITRAVLAPGSNNNDVNRLQGFNVLPISSGDFATGEKVKSFAIVARPSDAQLFVMSTLAGQPPAFQPNVLRDDNANHNRITYKASHIRTFKLVDKRAVVVSTSAAAISG